MPKKFSALNNSTIHTIALRTQHSAPDLRITLHALRITVYAQLKTLNPQRTTRNPFLRFTLYASRSTRNPQLISGLTPLLPANFTLYASRFTSHASRFTPHTPQGYNLGIKVVINKWVRKKSNPKEG